MANLFFRKGEYNGLFKGNNGQPLPLAEGTIYFTTDEGGMYIDTADKRVRIQGSVLYFDTLEHFVKEVQPPFSQDVLYFIAKSETEGKETKYNALLRWDGSKWIQLNVTADSFTALESLVNSHALSITNLQERLEAIDGGTTSQGSLAELANKITAVEETLNGKEGTTGLVDRVTAAEEDIKGHGTTLENYGRDISNQGKAITEIKEDLLPKYVEKEELDPVIEALSGDVNTLKDDRDDAKERLNAIDGADGRLARIDTSIQNLVNADTVFDTRVGNAEGRIGDLETASQNYDGRIIALETTVNGTDSVTGLVSRVGTLEGTVSTQGQTIGVQGAAITDIQTTIGDFTQLNDKFDSKDITGALNELYDKAAGIADDVEAHDGRLDKLEKAMGADGTGLPGQVANLATAVENLGKKDLAIEEALNKAKQDIIDLDTNYKAADKTINDKIDALDKAYKEADEDIAGDLADLAKLVEANGKTLLDKANQKDVDDAISDLEDLITSNIESANAMVFRSDIEVKDEASYILLKTRDDMAIGNTIIVQNNFKYDGVTYHAGDLLVAKSTAVDEKGNPIEVDGKILPENLDFIQVDTGYVASHNPKLSLSADGAFIELKDYVGGSLGNVKIATQSGLTIEADGDNANQLNINMTWGEF